MDTRNGLWAASIGPPNRPLGPTGDLAAPKAAAKLALETGLQITVTGDAAAIPHCGNVPPKARGLAVFAKSKLLQLNPFLRKATPCPGTHVDIGFRWPQWLAVIHSEPLKL